jgi:hypothetical protein
MIVSMKDATVAGNVDTAWARPYARSSSQRCAKGQLKGWLKSSSSENPLLLATGILPVAITDTELLLAVLLILMIPGLLSYLVPVRRHDDMANN